MLSAWATGSGGRAEGVSRLSLIATAQPSQGGRLLVYYDKESGVGSASTGRAFQWSVTAHRSSGDRRSYELYRISGDARQHRDHLIAMLRRSLGPEPNESYIGERDARELCVKVR